MRLRLFLVTMFVLMSCLTVSGQNATCSDNLSQFEDVTLTSNPAAQQKDANPTMSWYGECILVNAGSGLWLYDPDRPDSLNRLMLSLDEQINKVAVNPMTRTLAVSLAQEQTIHLLSANGDESIVTADKQVITNIAFSHDGSQMAVASSDIVDPGFFFDARVQIWNMNRELVATLSSEVSAISDVFITKDENHVLTNGYNQGYLGDIVEYWDLHTHLRIWDYSDLLDNLDTMSVNDPLAVLMAAMQNDVVALGGLDGFHNLDESYGAAVHIWDPNTRSRELEIVIHRRGSLDGNNYLASLALQSDGLVLATAQNEGLIRLRSTEDGSMIAETDLSATGISQLAFSEDGSQLGVVNDGKVVVLDVQSLDQIATFTFPEVQADE